MMRAIVLTMVVGFLLQVGPVQADLRVLFRFDTTGVQVHRVMRLESQSDFSSQFDTPAPGGMPEGMIEIRWLDIEGNLLYLSHVSDPRVTHSPNHTNGFTLSRLGLAAGGWIADGPELSDSVIVALSEKTSLGLPAETWTLSLGGKN